ncbi:hypothetical protein [Saccharothrix australiensis]|uniref:hypothetical protein n=1 Tax=Saccharothrix australiensis TaxID=2072 RepID=UPI0011C38F4F|nr:hypothetical protein [Saccharothrix australiensis]
MTKSGPEFSSENKAAKGVRTLLGVGVAAGFAVLSTLSGAPAAEAASLSNPGMSKPLTELCAKPVHKSSDAATTAMTIKAEHCWDDQMKCENHVWYMYCVTWINGLPNFYWKPIGSC